MTYESRDVSKARDLHRGRTSRIPAVLGLAGAAFLSTVAIGTTQAQTAPLPPSRVESANWIVEFSPDGTYQSTVPGHANIKIATKGAYTIDKNFPWVVHLLNPPSNKNVYTKASLNRGDGTFADTSAAFKAGFVAGAVGKQTLLAAVHLGVCTTVDQKPVCTNSWVNVSLTVDVVPKVIKDDKATDPPKP
jgi:hypothetical protein